MVEKVYAYITNGPRLLVFKHPLSPDAGIQVPGGTVGEGEDPTAAVPREAYEETGLDGLVVERTLGDAPYISKEDRAVTVRRFYHLACPGSPPAAWRHYERDPPPWELGPIPFDFEWVQLPDGVPSLAVDMDRMIPQLVESLGLG